MKKKVTIDKVKRDVLLKALPHIPFDGWTNQTLQHAAMETNYTSDWVETAFPNGVDDLVFAFARYLDEQTLGLLKKIDTKEMRVRDKIKTAVKIRLNVVQNYREQERMAVSFYAMPSHIRQGTKSLWCTADMMWDFAGDTAQDYNRYTKRGLLSGVLAKMTLYWLQDDSQNYQDTETFLDRQIERVLFLGKNIGRAKKAMDRLWQFMPLKPLRD